MLCHSSGWMSAAGVGVELGGGAGDGRRHWRGKPVIEAYHRAPVRVRDPDPQSPAVAASLAEMISSAVPGLRAEHVGSSAVPDLAGKGTIDLLLPTPAERVAEVADALCSDRSLRRDYADLKRSIVARGLTNAIDFTEAKQDFIVATLRRLGFR